jgi:glycerol-3-phosphate dehydrogenase
MGANIAADVAKEEFSEATIGFRQPKNGELFTKLFNTDYFHCTAVKDVEGVEICGTLKNIVACVHETPHLPANGGVNCFAAVMARANFAAVAAGVDAADIDGAAVG